MNKITKKYIKTKLKKNKSKLEKYEGFLKNSKAFKDGALKYQKKIRSEWKN